MNKFLILVVATLALACAQARPDAYDAAAETREYKSDLKEDGSYNYQYQTSNGIAGQESGVGGYYASGSSAYYAPDGQLVQLTYTADENGYHPVGAHLPTPPPIPAAILKSLEYIRTHPHQEQRQGQGRF
ncbi:pupal cuticle protein Edg-78E [Drosophila pseudoobscura]|uniref:Pupal cuticle protein Edg-78E n=1 Tax=Drosophila pseudoobscura pseudoobscura TaxID=46245 RepID=A0A6I8V078_DROPS|nr:pupal cuticle protein Edg-78E [Drosophila pseudoobscura]